MTTEQDPLLSDIPCLGEQEDSARRPEEKNRARAQTGTNPAVAVVSADQPTPESPGSQARMTPYIERFTQNHKLPPAILRFLDTHWRSYLWLTYSRDGRKSDSFREAVRTMHELCWSVRRKEDVLRRRRFLELLQRLYSRLQVGLGEIKMAAADQDVFFAYLAKLHQAAMSSENPQARTIPSRDPAVYRAGAGVPPPQFEPDSLLFDSELIADLADLRETDDPSPPRADPKPAPAANSSSSLRGVWSDPTQIWFQ